MAKSKGAVSTTMENPIGRTPSVNRSNLCEPRYDVGGHPVHVYVDLGEKKASPTPTQTGMPSNREPREGAKPFPYGKRNT